MSSGVYWYPPLKPDAAVTISPRLLVSPLRFDLPIKVIYARHRIKNVHKIWAKSLYLKHIKIWNGFFEKDPPKRSPEDFLLAFEDVIRSIGEHGFQASKGVIPVSDDYTPINGSHRIAAAIAWDKEVGCSLGAESPDYSYYRFLWRDRNGEFTQEEWDSVASEYCRLRNDVSIALLFPVAVGKHREIQNYLRQAGAIVYEKSLDLDGESAVHLIRLIYQQEPWVGSTNDQFSGARGKAARCFARNGPVRFFLLQGNRKDKLVRVKGWVRDLFNAEKHSVHITDSYQEVLRLSEALLNPNALARLRRIGSAPTPNHDLLISRLRQWIRKQDLDPEDICVTGGGVLSACSLRDCRDLDLFIGSTIAAATTLPVGLGNHESDQRYYPVSKEQILYNPRFHFFLDGIKFASLDTVWKMKLNRREEKDLLDSELIARSSMKLRNLLRKRFGTIFDFGLVGNSFAFGNRYVGALVSAILFALVFGALVYFGYGNVSMSVTTTPSATAPAQTQK